MFQVAADGAPELAEIYSLSITAVRTVSPDISQLGIAELDSQATMATITVEASDNPHGVVEFQSTSVAVESEESSPVTLTIVREFGTIGKQSRRYISCATYIHVGVQVVGMYER